MFFPGGGGGLAKRTLSTAYKLRITKYFFFK